MAPYLHLTQLTKSFGTGSSVVDIDLLSIKKGQIAGVVGESGSGKTTLMRLIAGLETPSAGTISLNGKMVNDTKVFTAPDKRNVGLVFQDYALFPHLTVKENIGYGLSSKKDAEDRVKEMLGLVGLQDYEVRYPHQLSGGQQQRVAIARALAPNPELLILDEPFSNLDTSLKLQLRNEVFSIIKNTGVTALFVTHDVEDAIAIADKIVVLTNGKVTQQGTAKEIYVAPVNMYVAGLFGTVTELSESTLKSFGYSSQKGKHYALRQRDFLVDKNAKFISNGTVIKSAFKEGRYISTVKVSNDVLVNCITKRKLNGSVTIGFKRKSLLCLKDDRV
jgi:iron(III) transport system ATP-binding protein